MNKEKNVKKAFLWNMIGSTCYSGSSFLYLLVVTRVCGAQLAGFYSLSYATAQLLLQVGRYGVRTYQATDLEHKYIFSEYKVSRIITCALMMLFGIIYSSFSFKGEYIIISTFIIMRKIYEPSETMVKRHISTEIFSKSTMLSRWEKCWRREICIPQFFSPLCLLSPRTCTAPVLLLLQPPLFCVLSLTHR